MYILKVPNYQDNLYLVEEIWGESDLLSPPFLFWRYTYISYIYIQLDLKTLYVIPTILVSQEEFF